MTQSIFLSDLDWYGVDAWNRPVWQHRGTGAQYCLVDELYDPDDPQARLKAMERLVAYKASLYVKEGEPSHPVHYCRRPGHVRCTKAPAGQDGFTQGGLYEVYPASASTTCWVLPHLFEVRDNLGHWRHMDFRQLTFMTSKGRVLFSQVET
ncbi:MAG: hypothetical protein HLX48_01995 [Halomonas sp.]|uniref:hypothetical protein n=1 Tax=Halomonas sp. TaxID=1486246 RepID=UPI0018036E14|nr:hypothetical protein [Halomonas sp.]NWN81755.1 hypothetical protein [Halomonas sp.]